MQWPEIVELNDVTLTPLAEDNGKLRMTLHADPPSPLLQHLRGGKFHVAMQVLPADSQLVRQAVVVEEPTIYGGPLFRHFGHALSESIHRVWPRLASHELRGAKIAFTLVNDTKVMPYVTQALNMHGIRRAEIIRIDRPMTFRRLFVAPQARQMIGPTIIPNYRTMLDARLEQNIPDLGFGRRLYLSRLHHHHTGSYYGESYVESYLAGQGFEIIYPEKHSLLDMIALFRASEIAVFAEGSAIHILELCGSRTPDSFVIGRRKGAIARFTPLLSDVCDRFAVSDHLVDSFGMPPNEKKHSGFLDMRAVLADMKEFCALPAIVDDLALGAAIEADAKSHVSDPKFDDLPDREAVATRVMQRISAHWAVMSALRTEQLF